MGAADRLNLLLAEPGVGLDRLLAVIASVDPVDDHEPSTDQVAATEAAVVAALDHLADGCPDPADPDALFGHVYGSLGFSGDVDDYYDPANSLLDRVIDRRRGIPLSLAAVVAEIARRNGRDLRPVGMPGHVLLGEGPEPTRWYDPFNRGVALGMDDCRSLFGRLQPIEAFEPEMLRPMTGLEVCVRTLNNLRIAYARRGEPSRIIPVLSLRADLPSGRIEDREELADLMSALGRFEQAAVQYGRLGEDDPANRERHLGRRQACLANRN
ncbi:MAG: transglutaminase-like domain-containing protein [Actinomycetota bacterium]